MLIVHCFSFIVFPSRKSWLNKNKHLKHCCWAMLLHDFNSFLLKQQNKASLVSDHGKMITMTLIPIMRKWGLLILISKNCIPVVCVAIQEEGACTHKWFGGKEEDCIFKKSNFRYLRPSNVKYWWCFHHSWPQKISVFFSSGLREWYTT